MNGGGKAATRSKAHRSGSVPEEPESSSHSTVTDFYRVRMKASTAGVCLPHPKPRKFIATRGSITVGLDFE